MIVNIAYCKITSVPTNSIVRAPDNCCRNATGNHFDVSSVGFFRAIPTSRVSERKRRERESELYENRGIPSSLARASEIVS